MHSLHSDIASDLAREEQRDRAYHHGTDKLDSLSEAEFYREVAALKGPEYLGSKYFCGRDAITRDIAEEYSAEVQRRAHDEQYD